MAPILHRDTAVVDVQTATASQVQQGAPFQTAARISNQTRSALVAAIVVLSTVAFNSSDTLASEAASGNPSLIRSSVRVDRDVATERRLAAEAGDATAQYALGWNYARGQGAPEDHREAIRWLHLAAQKGNADAQYALGMAQFTLAALGVFDAGYEAYRLFTLAAYQGHAKAAYHVHLMFDHSYDWEARTARIADDAEPWVRLVAKLGVASTLDVLK